MKYTISLMLVAVLALVGCRDGSKDPTSEIVGCGLSLENEFSLYDYHGVYFDSDANALIGVDENDFLIVDFNVPFISLLGCPYGKDPSDVNMNGTYVALTTTDHFQPDYIVDEDSVINFDFGTDDIVVVTGEIDNDTFEPPSSVSHNYTFERVEALPFSSVIGLRETPEYIFTIQPDGSFAIDFTGGFFSGCSIKGAYQEEQAEFFLYGTFDIDGCYNYLIHGDSDGFDGEYDDGTLNTFAVNVNGESRMYTGITSNDYMILLQDFISR